MIAERSQIYPEDTARLRRSDVIAAPRPLTTLVGRDGDAAGVRDILRNRDLRLVTLTGPGGVGKTRLALRAVEDLSEDFPDGIFFVDLSVIRNPEMVGTTIASVLGLQESSELEPIPALKQYLEYRQSLLILDNFEHLLTAARLTGEILTACPKVKILITSQAHLRVAGEQTYPVLPLDVPSVVGKYSAQEAGEAPAVRLFVSRANANRPDFALSSENFEEIVQICTRLDGLPLAIELAAARINLLTPRLMVERLERRLPLLTGGPRDLPDRLRTMRDAIGWSYELLTPEEQQLLRRLSVFSGGFTIDSLEAVAGSGAADQGPDLNLLDLLSSLMEKSLVRHAGEANGEPRFTMLSTIREFAQDALESQGEEDEARNAHTAWSVEWISQAEDALVGPKPALMESLINEQDNLRAALSWSCESNQAETSRRIASSAWRYWSRVGRLREGRDWMERAMKTTGPLPLDVEAKSLHILGNMLLDLGLYDEAERRYEEGLVIRRVLNEDVLIGNSLNGLGLVAANRGEHDKARGYFMQYLELSRKSNAAIGIGNALTNWGDVEMALGNLEQARALHEEALDVRRGIGNLNGIAYATYNLGAVAKAEGHLATALPLFQEALRLFRQESDLHGTGVALTDLGIATYLHGDAAKGASLLGESLAHRRELGDERGVVEAIEGIAAIAAGGDRQVEAAQLIGAVDARRSRLNAPLAPLAAAERDVWSQTLAALIGANAWKDAIADGRQWSIEKATDTALQLATTISAGPIPISTLRDGASHTDSGNLSPREKEVLALLATGLTDQAIADELFIARRTVTTHVLHIYAKLGVANRAEASAEAVRQGWV